MESLDWPGLVLADWTFDFEFYWRQSRIDPKQIFDHFDYSH